MASGVIVQKEKERNMQFYCPWPVALLYKKKWMKYLFTLLLESNFLSFIYFLWAQKPEMNVYLGSR